MSQLRRSGPWLNLAGIYKGIAARSGFLRGENGTGKSVLARSLHRLSSRSEKPFVTASAPTLPD